MNLDLEAFKIIPRNDVLIYLHQQTHLNHKIKMVDLYERINKPTYLFSFIIEDLINLGLITCKNFKPSGVQSSHFPDQYISTEINITIIGVDYVESKLFGYNLSKYHPDDPLDKFNYRGFSSFLNRVYKKTFEYFQNSCKHNINLVAEDIYYLCTGKNHKPNSEKKIFISYSWDNEEHKQWVAKLAQDLSMFSVEYDDNLKYGMSPLNYMKSNILSSDFVLIVFTSGYVDRLSKDGSGAQYEFSIISEELFRKISGGKFLPILRNGDKEKSIPVNMQDAIYLDFRDGNQYKILIEELKSRLSE